MPKNNKSTIALSIVVAALVIGGAILYATKPSSPSGSSGSSAQPQNQNSLAARGLSTEGLPVLGDSKAPATILEFGDFQCSYCAMFFSQTEPTLQKEFIDTGKANMVFKTLAFIGK